MGFLNNIKVSQKLALIGVLAFIATVIVGMLGYFSLKSAQEDIQSLYNNNTMSIYHIGRVRYNTRWAQVQSSLQPYTVAPDRRQDRIQKFEQATKEAEEAMQEYEKLNANHPNRAALAAEARKTFNEYTANSRKLLQMNAFDGGDERAPMNFYEENVMPNAVALGDVLAKIQEECREEAEESLKEGWTRPESVRW